MMKPLLISALLLAGAAILSAQNMNDPLMRSVYQYNEGFRTLMGDANRNAMQLSAMKSRFMLEDQLQMAELDRQYPPVLVVSRVGQRIFPKRARILGGENAKSAEALFESYLDDFEIGLRSRPHALLDFPHTHLATAWMLSTVRRYMVLRGLDDVSPDLARDLYWRFRQANRSPQAAKFIENLQEVQAHYEFLLIDSVSLDADWQSARMRGDRGMIESIQKRVERGFSETFGISSADLLRQLDAVHERTRGNAAGRTTLRVLAPPGGWRQFDFQKSEDFEYKLEVMAAGQLEKGSVHIGVRVQNGDRTISISASLAGKTMAHAVTYKRAEGPPNFTTLPWAQTDFGKLVASLLLAPMPELTARVLTPGQKWSSRNGQTEAQSEITGPCKQGEGLNGQQVAGTIRLAASAAVHIISYCLGSDVPLPISVDYFLPGVSIAANMVRRSAAEPAIPR
ncbi:MAG: hypothetical protein HY820_43780 [Acidobacteria bacterium]|nr:hypothetical protein [Acidobacteriota bacterium]